MNTLPALLKRVSRETWLSVLSIFLLFALWEIIVGLGWVNSTFLLAPSAIVAATIDLLGSGELLSHTAVTLARMFAGFFIGTILGLVLGLAMGWSKEIRAFFDPIVSIIYPLPKIALLPLIMLVIGVGEAPIIFVIVLGAFFPVLVSSMAGVLSIDKIYFDVAQNYGASRWKTFTRVMLPGSLPMAFAGIRIALGISLLLAVVVELAISSNGLGAMLWLSWQTLAVGKIYAAIATIALLGLLLNPMLKLISRRLVPWREDL